MGIAADRSAEQKRRQKERKEEYIAAQHMFEEEKLKRGEKNKMNAAAAIALKEESNIKEKE